MLKQNKLVLGALIVPTLMSMGCKNPICRVGQKNGRAEMVKWAKIENEKLGWGWSWQRLSDFRGKKIFINTPDYSELCSSDCEKPKKQIDEAINLLFFRSLRASDQFEIVANRSESDFVLNIKIAKTHEYHYFQYISAIPPTNYYIIWLTVSSTENSVTAFWARSLATFDWEYQRGVYRDLLLKMNNHKKNHGVW